jgi:hypothetical protein
LENDRSMLADVTVIINNNERAVHTSGKLTVKE